MDAVFKLSPVALAIVTFSALAEQPEVIEITGQVLSGVDAVITTDDLDKQQAQDLNDIFRKTPEVTVGGATPATQKLYVRGLEDSLLNIYIDGALQSGRLFHHQGRLTVDPDLLKQVEVSAGAGRATNGPGALGGSIKFKTKDAHDLLNGSEKFGAQVKTGYLSNSDGYTGNVSLYGEISEGLGLLGTLSYLDQGDLVDGNGDTHEKTALEQTSALIKLSGQLDSKNYISLAYDVYVDHNERAHRPEWAPSVDGFYNPAFDQEMDRYTATASYKYSGSEKLNIETTLYQTKSTISHKHPDYGHSYGDTDTFGGFLQNTSTIGNLTLIAGTDYRKDEVIFTTSGVDYPEQGTVWGVYLQNDWQPIERLLISFGGRYDWYSLDSNDGKKIEMSGFSPNVGLEIALTNNIKLFTSYAEAIRGPVTKQLFDLYRYGTASDLKKEEAENFEFGTTFSSSIFNAGITVFHSEIENVITSSRSDRVYGNRGTLDNQGISAFLGLTYDSLNANLSYNTSAPKLNGEYLNDENRSLGTTVGDTWVLTTDYDLNGALSLGWTSTFVERMTDISDPTVSSEKPGYAVHDLYAQWLPLSNEDLILTLSIKNIFDKYYQDHGTYAKYVGYDYTTGLAAPGRDFRFNVSYAF
ncbi:TonB-dependent receptor [Vibrio ponticus]|uniref:TonB-dependent receptor n=1 Tax=Vibrio ponticus TaxID=265668 RepID=A0A3N3DZU0_9VIBR|nr:TonB-dependent receptor [Vibrio ponticus]ROV59932.1 TonB-dependent receptor [Vibrio ponticus]